MSVVNIYYQKVYSGSGDWTKDYKIKQICVGYFSTVFVYDYGLLIEAVNG